MSSGDKPLSLRAYARSRRARGLAGGSLAAVQKAIVSGRIQVVEKGLINPAEADQQWLAQSGPRLIGHRAEVRELLGLARGLVLRLERLAGESREAVGAEPV